MSYGRSGIYSFLWEKQGRIKIINDAFTSYAEHIRPIFTQCISSEHPDTKTIFFRQTTQERWWRPVSASILNSNKFPSCKRHIKLGDKNKQQTLLAKIMSACHFILFQHGETTALSNVFKNVQWGWVGLVTTPTHESRTVYHFIPWKTCPVYHHC